MNREDLKIFADLSLELSRKRSILEYVTSFVETHENQLSRLFDDAESVYYDVAELRAEIERKQAEYESRMVDVESFINSIDDELIRILMRLHYLRGLTWAEASALIHKSEEGIKKKVYKALDKLFLKGEQTSDDT